MLQFSDQDNKAMLQRGSDPQWVAKQFAFLRRRISIRSTG